MGNEVQRRRSEAWESIGKLKCTSSQQYAFQDRSPKNGINGYRIRQVDIDGSDVFSHEKEVLFKNNLIDVFPNPVRKELYISTDEESRTSIYNLSGVRVFSTTKSRVDMSKFDNGLYIVAVGNARFKVLKI